MDLKITAFLLFILFTAGQSLSCYECSRGSGPMDLSCSDQEVNTCSTESSKCVSSTGLNQVGGITIMSRGKSCSADCQSGSLNVGFLRSAIECCDTDLCNANYTPDPRTMVSNGKTCYSCDEKSCSNIMCCSGSEDGCITMTPRNLKEIEGNSGGHPRVLKGCITISICNPTVSSTEVISCCSGNLCNGDNSVSQDITQSVTQCVNGAESVPQSVLFLCCSLLSFILLH